jgi:hypothetical protein
MVKNSSMGFRSAEYWGEEEELAANGADGAVDGVSLV